MGGSEYSYINNNNNNNDSIGYEYVRICECIGTFSALICVSHWLDKSMRAQIGWNIYEINAIQMIR